VRKVTIGAIVMILIAMTSRPTRAQGPPPADGSWIMVCHFHGEANQGQSAWHKDEKCNLPRGFKLDRTYHQAGGVFAGGGATSDLTDADIPAGLWIDTSGGNTWWSIVKPIEFVWLDDNGDDAPMIRQFRLHTYCGPQGGSGAGCSVNVTVYAKKKM
jgi:hypothetical protein